MDVVHGRLFDGKIRILTVIDLFTRISPAIIARLDDKGMDVVTTLQPSHVTSAIRKRFVSTRVLDSSSKELDLWAFMLDVTLEENSGINAISVDRLL